MQQSGPSDIRTGVLQSPTSATEALSENPMHRSMLAFAVLLVPLFLQNPQEAARSAQEVPKVGDVLPQFRLNDQDGQAVAVGGAADHWTVVAFYPKAATAG